MMVIKLNILHYLWAAFTATCRRQNDAHPRYYFACCGGSLWNKYHLISTHNVTVCQIDNLLVRFITPETCPRWLGETTTHRMGGRVDGSERINIQDNHRSSSWASSSWWANNKNKGIWIVVYYIFQFQWQGQTITTGVLLAKILLRARNKLHRREWWCFDGNWWSRFNTRFFTG